MVQLSDKAESALDDLATPEAVTPTSAVNRAIQVYAFLVAELMVG